ncbi:MAG TPA: ABC transporter ATP-binding protein [Planctomycetota bacterium]|nr:ABC transporter ATP-binding protein [Planctomycetota bacterium]
MPAALDSPTNGHDAQPVIEVTDVVKTFNGRNVLDGVSLTVRRGETLVIMGASGCGKSTLLRCLIGAHSPDKGTIKLFGKDMGKMRTRELDGVRKRFGILFQSGALFSSMTVGENVALPLKEHARLSADMVDLMVKVKLELVGLREAEDRLPSEISGGMAKRAGLARAIALDPELLFYDEPTSGLDPIMTQIIDSLIVDLARTMNVTSVVVTHDLKSAFRVADRMVVLNNGRIVQQGQPHEVRASSDPFVKRFIHGPVESKTVVLQKTPSDRAQADRPPRGSDFFPNPGATLVSSSPRLRAVEQKPAEQKDSSAKPPPMPNAPSVADFPIREAAPRVADVSAREQAPAAVPAAAPAPHLAPGLYIPKRRPTEIRASEPPAPQFSPVPAVLPPPVAPPPPSVPAVAAEKTNADPAATVLMPPPTFSSPSSSVVDLIPVNPVPPIEQKPAAPPKNAGQGGVA